MKDASSRTQSELTHPTLDQAGSSEDFRARAEATAQVLADRSDQTRSGFGERQATDFPRLQLP